jgi:hypothetical protein
VGVNFGYENSSFRYQFRCNKHRARTGRTSRPGRPSEPGRGLPRQLSQRIAFFIAKDRYEAREIFENAKNGYDFRSQIAHGAWHENNESQALLADVETHARQSLMRVLLNDDLLKTFSGKDKARNEYLDDLVFKGFGLADQDGE